MKTIFLSISWICLAFSLHAQGDAGGKGPVAQALELRQKYSRTRDISLFTPNLNTRKPDLSAYLRQADYLTINQKALDRILHTQPDLIRFTIPGADRERVLELYRAEIFSPHYTLRTSDRNIAREHQPMVFYRGVVAGVPGSLAAVSMIGDRVQIIFSSASDGDIRIQQAAGEQYVLYRERDQITREGYTCDAIDVPGSTGDAHLPDLSQRAVLTGNCVEVYFECDFKSFQDNGSSVLNTEAWVGALFNEVATLYENESIPVFISDVLVWTSSDPYAGLNSTSALLNEFVNQTTQNGYDGRLAHLLSTRSLGGGIAYINVLCSSTHACAVSTSLSTNIVEFPTYSWNVECVTHEMGHNFGSNHTHKCVWNGNNTQIDDCGSVAGDTQPCYNSSSPILPDDGTIMSYCHLVGGVGISFALGFGDQPGDLIRAKYNNATCNTGVCSPPPCTALTSPADQEIDVEISTNITWAITDPGDGYRITIGTTPGTGNIADNVDVGQVNTFDPPADLPYGTTIYVKIVPYNILGPSTGCMSESFMTELNVAPACTELSSPMEGAVDVPPNSALEWEHAVGAQLGYQLSLGTTPGGTDLLNALDVGNVNTYTPGNLPFMTTVYARVTPYWAGGDITGCPVRSFTTGGPEYCNSGGIVYSDEWIAGFSLGTYSHPSGGQGYSDFSDEIIHVSAGSSYPITVTPGFSGQVYTEYIRVWIDSNHDGIFDNPGERVFQASGTSTVSGTIQIPSTMLTGPTRIRVSLKWGGYSTPCQVYNYGETEDYTLQVHCNLVTTTSDQGVGSLPWVLNCVSPGETVAFAQGLQGDTILLQDQQAILTKAVTITADPTDNIWIRGVSVEHTVEVLAGVQATIHGLHLIGGTAQDGSAIHNAGILNLQDCHLYTHPGATGAMLLHNSGTLHLNGMNMFH